MKRKRVMWAAGAGLWLTVLCSFTALAAQGQWIKEDGEVRYVDENGSLVKSEWRKREGVSLYLDREGKVAVDTWVEDTYYVGSDGAMKTEAWVYEDGTDSGKEKGWYYLGRDGKAEKNDWKTIDGTRYAFDGKGRMRIGWFYEGEDIYYLGNEEEGYTIPGWRYLESDGEKRAKAGTISKDLAPGDEGGRWFYFQTNGKAKRGKTDTPEAVSIDDKKYYFDENGVMLTGWYSIRDKSEPGDSTGISRFAYLGGREEGILRNQWLETKEDPWKTGKEKAGRYYLDSRGIPVFLHSDADSIGKGAVKIDGAYYFFDPYGQMQTGLIRIKNGNSSQTGYFGPEDGDGKMITGRVTGVTDKEGKEWICYFDTSGSNKGAGFTGVKDGFLYAEGVLGAAEEGTGYEACKAGGRVYLVNEAGKVQTEEKTYVADGEHIYIKGGIVYTEASGEKTGPQMKEGKKPETFTPHHVYGR